MGISIFKNIGAIVGASDILSNAKVGSQMSRLDIVYDAWMAIADDRIMEVGSMADFPEMTVTNCQVVDLDGQWVFPSFCDSHTHIVYAGSRHGEFIDKIRGLSYEEIAARGGGILNSADLLHQTTEDELYRQAMERVNEMIDKGTGAIEIKSGYGLNTADELKMLRVIQRIRRNAPVEVKSTFLGAHAVGRSYAGRQSDYVDLVCREMIPEVGRQKLADYIDVFCDNGFFTPAETDRMLEAAHKWGLKPKIHANELAVSGGVQVGVSRNAVSVDHLERTTDAEIEALRNSTTIATMLPGASFFLGMPYGDARKFVDAGIPLALASDYNPGSSPSGDMRFVAALGCIKMKLTPEEAFNATTINGAAAMEMAPELGSLTPGKIANFYTTMPLPSVAYPLYAYTSSIITHIWLAGEKIY